MTTLNESSCLLSRRKLFISLPAVFAGFRSIAEGQRLQKFHLRKKKPVAAAPSLVYFGTDTSRGISKGIYSARFDATTGTLTAPVLAAATVRPSYFALGPIRSGKRLLYSVAEGGDLATSCINSFLIDPKSGALQPLNRVSAGATGPCYISVDSTDEAVFVADYDGGAIASFRILPDGKLSEPVETLDFEKDMARFGPHGPNGARQSSPHPHSTLISPDNRFLIVNDLGDDAIDLFPIDPASAHFGQMEPHRFTNNHPGSGPRHTVFHPNRRWVYSINELDATIDRFLWTMTHKGNDSQALLVDTLSSTKLLAPGFPVEKNTSAELEISPNGFFLYASNRGEDTLVVFSIDQTSGDLKLVQRIPCGGKAPRHFTIAPNGDWLICGNQNSGSVTVFKLDDGTGKLTGPTQTVALDSPMFTLFV